jgi:acyl-CoA thioesterase-1
MAFVATQVAAHSARRLKTCLLTAALAVGLAVPASACTVPKELTRLHAPLAKFAAAVQDSAPLKIIALGSSSTAGAGASSQTKSYPAQLQAELDNVWPDQKVRVINAGVGGQLASDMVARIDKDVLAQKPQLVIWQTGVNDAVRGVPIEVFRKMLVAGIERVHKANIDILMVDQQYYPKFEKVKNGPLYISAIREVAQKLRVPVLQRFTIMKHLIDSRQFTPASMLSPDQFHLNDSSYRCLGKLLAESLRGAATTTTTVEPVHGGKRL